MIDYRLEIEKLVDQVAEHELQNCVLAAQQAADRLDLEARQEFANLEKVFDKKTSGSPAVVYIGPDGQYTLEGDTDELVTAIKEGCGETGIAAFLSKFANEKDQTKIKNQKVNLKK